MKTILRRLGLLAFGLVLAATSAKAQLPQVGFSATPSTDSLAVSNSVTYTFSLTNVLGVADIMVTNSFSGPVEFQGTNVIVNFMAALISVTTNGNILIYDFIAFQGIVQASVTVAPLGAGLLTNAITAAAPMAGLNNLASTNVVVQVTNRTISADLAVSMTGPGRNVFAGDLMSYTVAVTNAGPASVPHALLTNNLPAGTRLISVSPGNQTFTLTNRLILFDLGTLNSASSSTISLTVQPTNAGVLTFSASVGAVNLLDTNLANNSASTNITVDPVVPGQFVATNLTAMLFDPQTGLMNQSVRLWNFDTTSAPAVRLVVSGQTNALFNAVGTSNGNPYVVYGSTLATNQSVDLVLEYFVPSRVPFIVSNSSYTAVSVSAPSLTVTNITNALTVARVVPLASGYTLIEFPAVPNANYTVVYSTNAAFANALKALPNIIAPGDRVQWIDNGPPKTISLPWSVPSRFYKVIKN
jgi:uncharacterized repeat protein (TIGR01451 family)